MSEFKRKGVVLVLVIIKLLEKKVVKRMSKSNRIGLGMGSRVVRGFLDF